MKIKLTAILIVFTNLVLAQETKYIHCDCTETLTEQAYSVLSNGIKVESGQFENGKRTGNWLSKNSKGTTIRNANYLDGKLHGAYELFHFDGNPKLKAEFESGSPKGEWIYYNAKGRIIKQGTFTDGKPSGKWKILDKKGKKQYAEYDFNTNTETMSAQGNQYFQKGGIIRDDQSGEWMILYLPRRNIKVKTQPLGGYMLASDLFADYFIVPTIFMNTYAQYEFDTKLKIENGSASVISSQLIEDNYDFDITSHSLTLMVETNSPNKLSAVKHSKASINFLKEQLAEFILISGPWIGEQSEVITIQSPIVINKINRW